MKRLLVAGTVKTAKIKMANEWVIMEIQYCIVLIILLS